MRQVIAAASPPLARIAAATSSHGASLREEMTTRAPESAKPSAIARPMPRDEPVTIATLPERSKRFIAFPQKFVTPAEAGVQGLTDTSLALDARFRGHDGD